MTPADQGEREVDAYIEAAPEPAKPLLRELRRLIRETAPEARERISYRMPFYEYRGRLIYFGLHRDHVGIYPIVGLVRDRLGEELRPFLSGRGTARFPLGQPLPLELIRKVLVARMEELEAEARAKEERRKERLRAGRTLPGRA